MVSILIYYCLIPYIIDAIIRIYSAISSGATNRFMWITFWWNQRINKLKSRISQWIQVSFCSCTIECWANTFTIIYAHDWLIFRTILCRFSENLYFYANKFNISTRILIGDTLVINGIWTACFTCFTLIDIWYTFSWLTWDRILLRLTNVD